MTAPAIIFEDDALIVLNKPALLLVHVAHPENIEAGDTGSEETLASWLLERYPQVKNVGEGGREGIVHRLDRETSGIMLAALTPQALERLKKQFARREVRKTYRAFVYGGMKEERGIIEKAIGRSATGNRTAKLRAHNSGEIISRARESQTTFRTLMQAPLASYLELYPKTGRTHQIRVHLSVLQHPVIGDKRYAPSRPAILGFSRLALHAYKLSFVHPITGKELSFEAPLPPDFIKAEKVLKQELRSA